MLLFILSNKNINNNNLGIQVATTSSKYSSLKVVKNKYFAQKVLHWVSFRNQNIFEHSHKPGSKISKMLVFN